MKCGELQSWALRLQAAGSDLPKSAIEYLKPGYVEGK